MIELSAYSDWKAGALTEEERDDQMRWEARRDEYEDEPDGEEEL